jgi:hypothetical protein
MMRTLAARHTVQARAPLTTGVFPLWGRGGLRGGKEYGLKGMRDIRGLCLLVILMVSVDGILRGLHFMKRDETGCKCDDRQEKEGEEERETVGGGEDLVGEERR